ncbi:MAG: class I SAM-dependent methyltransferase [Myxococcales bacterium]|nr:class I SAM-dependent methyltransferase [Myxococcales bacterium]
MTEHDPSAHWSAVYRDKAHDAVSWYQRAPGASLALVRAAGLPAGARILDVGAGASTLADALVDGGYDLTLLDVASPALEVTRARLGDRASKVRFVVADVTAWQPDATWDLWHDRAVFHFLVDPSARAAYVRALSAAVAPGGQAVIGAFAPDGPERCSGLPVRRYSPEGLAAELGDAFSLVEAAREVHVTPWGAEQRFAFARLARR